MQKRLMVCFCVAFFTSSTSVAADVERDQGCPHDGMIHTPGTQVGNYICVGKNWKKVKVSVNEDAGKKDQAAPQAEKPPKTSR